MKGIGHPSVHRQATMIEAILGAIHLDCGMDQQVTKKAIEAMNVGENTTFDGKAQTSIVYQKPDVSKEPPTPVPGDQEEVAETGPEPDPIPGLLKRLRQLGGTRKHSRRRIVRRRLLQWKLPGGENLNTYNELVKAIRERLQTTHGFAQPRDQMPVIKTVLQTHHPQDPGYDDVKIILDIIDKADAPNSTVSSGETVDGVVDTKSSEKVNFGASPSPAVFEKEKEVNGESAVKISFVGISDKGLHEARRLERRRLLRDFVPDNTTTTPAVDLMQSITQRLKNSPEDAEIRDNRRKIEGIVRGYTNDVAYECAQKLLAQMEESFGPSPYAPLIEPGKSGEPEETDDTATSSSLQETEDGDTSEQISKRTLSETEIPTSKLAHAARMAKRHQQRELKLLHKDLILLVPGIHRRVGPVTTMSKADEWIAQLSQDPQNGDETRKLQSILQAYRAAFTRLGKNLSYWNRGENLPDASLAPESEDCEALATASPKTCTRNSMCRERGRVG